MEKLLYIYSKHIQLGSRCSTAHNQIPVRPVSPLEKRLINAVICQLEKQADKQTSTHCKISLFTHKYQIQRQMRKSHVYVSKAFDHATFGYLKKTSEILNTASSTRDTKQCQIYIQYNTNNNITFSARERFYHIFYSLSCTISPAH